MSAAHSIVQNDRHYEAGVPGAAVGRGDVLDFSSDRAQRSHVGVRQTFKDE